MAKNRKQKSKRVARDEKKESHFRELKAILQSKGVEVRREVLKQGLGWKAVSGSCRVDEKRLVFVDRRLPQDDQVEVLAEALREVSDSDDAVDGFSAGV